MNIPINKDIETEYKNELYKGLTLRECGYFAVSVAVMGTAAVLLIFKSGLAVEACVYIGIACGVPILFLGFKKFQGGLTVFEYLKEILWERKTRVLTYDAGEIQGAPEPYTMESQRRRRDRKR